MSTRNQRRRANARRARQGRQAQVTVRAEEANEALAACVAYLSPAARMMAGCYRDPFRSTVACHLPSVPALASAKRVAYIKATATCATGPSAPGVVVFAMNPYAAMFNDGLAPAVGVRPAVYGSTSTFAGDVLRPAGSPAVGAALYNSNSVDTRATALPNQQFRVSCAGIRLRYIGQARLEGGRVIGYHSPDHIDLTEQSFDQLLQYPNIEVHRSDDEWMQVLWTPQTPDDYRYRDVSELTAAEAESYSLMAVGISPPGEIIASGRTPLLWEIESFVHYEVVGVRAPDQTASSTDVVGMAAVVQAAQEVKQLHKPPSREQWYERIGHYLHTAVSGVRTIFNSIPANVRHRLLELSAHSAARRLRRFHLEAAQRHPRNNRQITNRIKDVGGVIDGAGQALPEDVVYTSDASDVGGSDDEESSSGLGDAPRGTAPPGHHEL